MPGRKQADDDTANDIVDAINGTKLKIVTVVIQGGLLIQSGNLCVNPGQGNDDTADQHAV